jgi:hypothetical protein
LVRAANAEVVLRVSRLCCAYGQVGTGGRAARFPMFDAALAKTTPTPPMTIKNLTHATVNCVLYASVRRYVHVKSEVVTCTSSVRLYSLSGERFLVHYDNVFLNTGPVYSCVYLYSAALYCSRYGLRHRCACPHIVSRASTTSTPGTHTIGAPCRQMVVKELLKRLGRLSHKANVYKRIPEGAVLG